MHARTMLDSMESINGIFGKTIGPMVRDEKEELGGYRRFFNDHG
jgi:hypothetical protein